MEEFIDKLFENMPFIVKNSPNAIELVDDGEYLSVKGGEANETVRKADEEIHEDGIGNSKD